MTRHLLWQIERTGWVIVAVGGATLGLAGAAGHLNSSLIQLAVFLSFVFVPALIIRAIISLCAEAPDPPLPSAMRCTHCNEELGGVQDRCPYCGVSSSDPLAVASLNRPRVAPEPTIALSSIEATWYSGRPLEGPKP